MNFEDIKKILKTKTVGIAGCGGLGSNCAVALARTGIGKLIIADFDKIEESNLNRQYYFYDQIGQAKASALKTIIQRINPETIVESHTILLEPANIPSIFKDCDVIVEAFDRTEMKEMIMKVISNNFPEKHLIMGIGMAGWGANNLFTDKEFGNLIICGDGVNEIREDNPPLAPRVGIVANMQANVVLEILLGKNMNQIG
ncbi:MAG TPA: sulfur carrier protein ThiS adenylyltransferase ThiF [Bacteroidales bacterium]|nr:sulfur carrier protein ThiS adenylyltransferase ThiF [Bacteroidales bacterium]